jgi:hypothetical protein
MNVNTSRANVRNSQMFKAFKTRNFDTLCPCIIIQLNLNTVAQVARELFKCYTASI